MSSTRSVRFLLRSAVIFAAVAVVAALTVAPAAADENQGWVGEIDAPAVALLHGHYWWTADVSQPDIARMFGVPVRLSDSLDARTVTGRISWGDGTVGSVTTLADPAARAHIVTHCNDNWWPEPGSDPPYGWDELFGYQCNLAGDHNYAKQGLYRIRFTASQNTTEGPRTAWSERKQLIIDPAAGGSVTAQGTLTARSAGMFDPDFPQPGENRTANVRLSISRAAGTAATVADVLVTAPGVTPEYGRGMTFHGRYALAPLYVATNSSGTEVIATRIEGPVTNTAGSAGWAQAVIHLRTIRGGPTLMRVMVQNTSAGFTYLDTGYRWAGDDWSLLNPTHDRFAGTVHLGPPVAKVPSVSHAKLADRRIQVGQRGRLKVKVSADVTPVGEVTIFAGKKGRDEVKTVALRSSDNGRRWVKLPRSLRGKNKVHFDYGGSSQVTGSSSNVVKLRVRT